MILFSTFLQFTMLLIGVVIAKKAYIENRDIEFDSAHKESKLLITLSLVILLLFAISAVLNRFDSLLELTPLIYQKYGLIITWTLLAIFIGFVSGYVLFFAFTLKREKIYSHLASLILLNALFILGHNHINGYIGDRVKFSFVDKGKVLQTTNFSCTSASIATIARGFNIKADEKDAAVLSRLTRFGANSGQIRYALNRLGIKYETLNSSKYRELKEVKAPAILYVDHPVVGYEGHAVVYLGVDGDKYQIWDPLRGDIFLSKERVEKDWHGNGIRCFK